MWKQLLCLALAGALGTLARYGVSALVQLAGRSPFPWGTLLVNAAGCFLFGLIFPLAEGRTTIDPQTRFILLAGFMGAFTTFSTFGFETARLIHESQWGLAAANLLLG